MEIFNEFKKYINNESKYDELLNNLFTFFDKLPSLLDDKFPAILLEAYYLNKPFLDNRYLDTFTLDFSIVYTSINSLQDENSCCQEKIHLYLHYKVDNRKEFGLIKEVDVLPQSFNETFKKEFIEFKDYSSLLINELSSYFVGFEIEKE